MPAAQAAQVTAGPEARGACEPAEAAGTCASAVSNVAGVLDEERHGVATSHTIHRQPDPTKATQLTSGFIAALTLELADLSRAPVLAVRYVLGVGDVGPVSARRLLALRQVHGYPDTFHTMREADRTVANVALHAADLPRGRADAAVQTAGMQHAGGHRVTWSLLAPWAVPQAATAGEAGSRNEALKLLEAAEAHGRTWRQGAQATGRVALQAAERAEGPSVHPCTAIKILTVKNSRNIQAPFWLASCRRPSAVSAVGQAVQLVP